MNRPINLIILLALVLFSCNTKTPKNSEDPVVEKTNVRYRLTYDSAEKYPGYPNGRNLKFEVDKKYNTDELNVIADSIVKADNGLHSIVSVHWSYIEDYDNPDAWKSDFYATSMTREGKVVTTTEEEMKNRHAEKKNAERTTTSIGNWSDNVTKSAIYIVKDNDGNHFIQFYYPYFEPLEMPINKEKLNGKTVYTIPGNDGGFMSIDKDGVLRIYERATMNNILSFGK